MLAVCHRDDGHDIGELLIRLGHARDCQRASDGRYAAAEQQAQDEGRNLSRDYPLPRRCTL
jgi:endonuclease YncB( thermonuclease family)